MSKTYLYSEVHTDVLEQLCERLKKGAVGIYPTDTVYGIGALAGDKNQGSLKKIFEYKKRELSQTLPLLISSHEDLERYAQDIPDSCKKLVENFWPGALTVVLKAHPSVPDYLVKDDGSIALRIPDEKLICSLIDELGAPLATTSANIHNMPAPHSFDELDERLVEQVDFLIDGGACKKDDASTIVSFMSEVPEILRQGSLARVQIEELIGECRDRA